MTLPFEDVQSRVPSLSLSLSRVGVTNVEKVIRIRNNGAEQLFSARLDCFVDLGPHQKGAHMSRFEEVVNDAIGEVVLGESAFRAETLAQHIAEKVRDRQDARRAEVHIEARYPEHKPAPVSGIETQEIYSLLGAAVAERGRHAAADRRARAGDDRVPVRADARPGALARAAARGRLLRGRDRADLRAPCRSPPTTSAGSARCTSAARRPATPTSTPSGS